MVPIIGAIIGYATNWIAVKMLFRPHYEVRVFGIKLPFTPGVIPKGQGRMAKAVGQAVEEQLLNEEVLRGVLLSDATKEKVRAAVADWIIRKETSEEILIAQVGKLITQEKAGEITSELGTRISDIIYEKIREANVGQIVAQKALESAREKFSESMFGMFLSDSMLERIGELVKDKVNEYVDDHGHEVISSMTKEEIEKISNKPVGELVSLIRQHDIDLPTIVVTVYEELVINKLPDLLKALKLSVIVEDRINGMDVEEVEGLLLSIMKKELGAIVNLGALIGFVLGLANVALLLI